MLMTTRRYAIRDFTAADVAAFVAYRADPRFHRQGGEKDAPAAQDLLESFAAWAAAKPRLNYQLAVVERQGERMVGCAGLREITERAELGIEMAPDFWGRHGVAIEIIGALLAFAFGTLELREVYGITTRSNFRAARLATWFGATETRRHPRSGPIGGPGSDAPVEWCITRRAWAERRDREERPQKLI